MSEQTSDQLEQQAATGQQQQAETTAEQVVDQVGEAAQETAGPEKEELEAILAGYHKPSAQEQQEQPKEDQETAPRTIAGIPEDELATRLKKVDELEAAMNEKLRKVNNMLGNMKQRLETIPKDAPKAEVRAITAGNMRKLKELGFDELAEALAEDLSGNFSVQPSQQVDVQEVISKTMRETAEKELDDLHPGWKDLILTDPDSGEYQHPKFSAFVNTLAPEVQERVKTTTSAAYAVRTLDAYKAWEQGEAERQERARTTSESRLKNAMTPTQGKTASTPSRLPDESGLWAGYNRGPKPLRR